ncbi:MAG: TRAP transporter large permease subunit [Alphaproteobacteria bacterium]|jgi:TRAP-type mannitol/chloroaromatic compound transport system permease large subunit|nr:TRAP transporter large permease subunit [Alphaproteobacteria bacterium]
MSDLAALLDVLMFVSVFAVLLTGVPVAFALAGTALLFAGLGWAFGVFNPNFIAFLPQRIFGTMTNEVLIAVPLFIVMGVTLERSKVAEDLLEALGALFGRLSGGLGLSVTVVGALLAASTGIVGATVVTMGLLSLPTMLRHGYDPKLACGAICAAGTLGQIIPPSIVLVLLGDVIGAAFQTAQMNQGIFTPDTVSVGDLFAGALIPGLCLVGLYLAYQIGVAVVAPGRSPPIAAARSAGQGGAGAALRIGRVVRALVSPLVLMVAVLGSILGGIATPTEAAGVGAIGALLLAGQRLAEGDGAVDGKGEGVRRAAWPVPAAGACIAGLLVLTAFVDMRVSREVIPAGDMAGIVVAVVLTLGAVAGIGLALWRVWRAGILAPVAETTARLTTMVFTIVIAAALFSLVFRGLGGDRTAHAWLTDLPGGVDGAMLTVMLAMFLMGFFLDFVEITLVVVPIVAPILLSMGVDPVWLGVMMAVNLQTSFLTPPFGFALFYLRGVAPRTIRTADIYRGAVPFVIIQLIGLAAVALFPGLATWLPSVLFG